MRRNTEVGLFTKSSEFENIEGRMKMEILVCVKRVPDSAENEIEVKADGSDIKRDDLVYSVNEWDN
jgi:hypothetical protein